MRRCVHVAGRVVTRFCARTPTQLQPRGSAVARTAGEPQSAPPGGRYVRCLYVYNKIDMTSIEECERICSMPDTMVLSCKMDLNCDIFKEKLWEYLGLVRTYTKPRGKKPDFGDPLVLTDGRYGITVEAACKQVHRSLLQTFEYAMVWGTSVKHTPQRVGLAHVLQDEDVIQIVKKKGNDLKLDPSNQKAAWKDQSKSTQQQRKAKAKLKS